MMCPFGIVMCNVCLNYFPSRILCQKINTKDKTRALKTHVIIVPFLSHRSFMQASKKKVLSIHFLYTRCDFINLPLVFFSSKLTKKAPQCFDSSSSITLVYGKSQLERTQVGASCSLLPCLSRPLPTKCPERRTLPFDRQKSNGKSWCRCMMQDFFLLLERLIKCKAPKPAPSILSAAVGPTPAAAAAFHGTVGC